MVCDTMENVGKALWPLLETSTLTSSVTITAHKLTKALKEPLVFLSPRTRRRALVYRRVPLNLWQYYNHGNILRPVPLLASS